MITPRPSLARRLWLPLGASLALHALLPAAFFLAPNRGPDAPDRPAPPALSLAMDFGAPKARPAPGPSAGLPDDVFPELGHWDHGTAVVYAPGDGGGGGGPAKAASGEKPAGPRPALDSGRARRVAYVIDRSISMGTSDALARARREVAASLRALPPDARFRAFAYNRHLAPLSPDWLAADDAGLARAEGWLAGLTASGPTDHAAALRAALLAKPDVLFWVTDAGDLADRDVDALVRLAAGTAVHVVELAGGRDAGPAARLAAATGGVARRLP